MTPSRRIKLNKYNERRKQTIKTNGGSHTKTQWRELCEQFGNKCLCCGDTENLTKDHVLPLSLGGTNDISNLQLLCSFCNNNKNSQIVDYRHHGRNRTSS